MLPKGATVGYPDHLSTGRYERALCGCFVLTSDLSSVYFIPVCCQGWWLALRHAPGATLLWWARIGVRP